MKTMNTEKTAACIFIGAVAAGLSAVYNAALQP